MRFCIAMRAATVAVAVLDATAVHAQHSSPRVAARIVPGVAYEIGVFGDEQTRRHTEVGVTIAAQLWTRWSDSKSVVFEGAFQPNALENPFFDEKVRVLYLQVAPEFGRRTYLRPSAGLALRFWSGSETEETVDGALALGLAIGPPGRVGCPVRDLSRVFLARVRPNGGLTANSSIEHAVYSKYSSHPYACLSPARPSGRATGTASRADRD